MDIGSLLADELGLKAWQVDQTLQLFEEGGTVPFVARYRKEKTGGLDEEVLRNLLERHTYVINLEKRKAVVLERIAEIGALTEQLQEKIKGCRQTNVLEDLYLPFKRKRTTRAAIGRGRGLAPLAKRILDALERAGFEDSVIDPVDDRYRPRLTEDDSGGPLISLSLYVVRANRPARTN